MPVDVRRRQLLELGAELFARHSIDELSMAGIAREAGISKALLYHYFPSKHAFFVAALEQAADEVRRRTEPDPALPPEEALATSLDAFLAWVEENGLAYRKLLASAASVPEVGALIAERPRAHGGADPRRAGGGEPAAPGHARRRPRLALVHGRQRSRTGWNTASSSARSYTRSCWARSAER